MNSTTFGETAGSWIQWATMFLLAFLTILFGSRQYRRDHSAKLMYRILPYAEKRKGNSVGIFSGITIIIQNIGGVATSVDLLGISNHRWRSVWKIQMIIRNFFRMHKWTVRLSEQLYPKISLLEDAQVQNLIDWIREDVVNPNSKMLKPFGEIERIPVEEETLVRMLTTLAANNSNFSRRIKYKKTLYFDYMIQTSFGTVERVQRILYFDADNEIYQKLIARVS